MKTSSCDKNREYNIVLPILTEKISIRSRMEDDSQVGHVNFDAQPRERMGRGEKHFDSSVMCDDTPVHSAYKPSDLTHTHTHTNGDRHAHTRTQTHTHGHTHTHIPVSHNPLRPPPQMKPFAQTAPKVLAPSLTNRRLEEVESHGGEERGLSCSTVLEEEEVTHGRTRSELLRALGQEGRFDQEDAGGNEGGGRGGIWTRADLWKEPEEVIEDDDGREEGGDWKGGGNAREELVGGKTWKEAEEVIEDDDGREEGGDWKGGGNAQEELVGGKTPLRWMAMTADGKRQAIYSLAEAVRHGSLSQDRKVCGLVSDN